MAAPRGESGGGGGQADAETIQKLKETEDLAKKFQMSFEEQLRKSEEQAEARQHALQVG